MARSTVPAFSKPQSILSSRATRPISSTVEKVSRSARRTASGPCRSA